jgi:hypothetical protein
VSEDRIAALESRVETLEALVLGLLDASPQIDPLQQAHGAFVERIRARGLHTRENKR